MRLGPLKSCLFALVLFLPWVSGCSIKKMAINMVGNALADSGETFSSDNDPELIRDATPFSLKLMESLLESSPKHTGLLKASCKGFTMYAYAYLQLEADIAEGKDYPKAQLLRGRAKRMYRRSLGYGLRGLDLRSKGFEARMRADNPKALAAFGKKDVESLYWTGLSWMALVNIGKDDMTLIGDLGLAEKLMARAYELDPDWGEGTIREFYVTYDSRSEAMGGSVKRAREQYEKALNLSKGRRVSTYLALAESLSVKAQDRKEFDDLMEKALAIDPDADKPNRLLTLVYQKRARWLQSRASNLFAE